MFTRQGSGNHIYFLADNFSGKELDRTKKYYQILTPFWTRIFYRDDYTTSGQAILLATTHRSHFYHDFALLIKFRTCLFRYSPFKISLCLCRKVLVRVQYVRYIKTMGCNMCGVRIFRLHWHFQWLYSLWCRDMSLGVIFHEESIGDVSNRVWHMLPCVFRKVATTSPVLD